MNKLLSANASYYYFSRYYYGFFSREHFVDSSMDAVAC